MSKSDKEYRVQNLFVDDGSESTPDNPKNEDIAKSFILSPLSDTYVYENDKGETVEVPIQHSKAKRYPTNMKPYKRYTAADPNIEIVDASEIDGK